MKLYVTTCTFTVSLYTGLYKKI